MCDKRTKFRLLELQLGLSSEYMITGVSCDSCHFEVRTSDNEERHRLFQASEISKGLKADEVAEVAPIEDLEELESATIARILAESRSWKCPFCNESNPPDFLECWSCQKERLLDEETSKPA